MSNTMGKYITVKYFAKSEFAKVPYQASEDGSGYDLFATETKTLLPNSANTISLDLRLAIPTGFYGKLFPSSSLLKEHLVTVDAGVIDSDFRGIDQVLLVNHHREKTFTVRAENRIAQVVFMEKFNVDFRKVPDLVALGKTKRGHDRFCSTGIEVIKKVKTDNDVITSPEKITVNSQDNLQIISEKSEDDLQITSEKAVMEVNGEVIISESITIDE